MPDNLIQDVGGGWLAALATGLGVGGTAIYKAFRKVKEDVGEDATAKKAETLIDKQIARLEAEIARQNSVIVDLTSRVDKMAGERNDALAAAAKAQAEALVATARVEALEKEVAEMEEKLGTKDTGDRRRATDFTWMHPVDDRDKKDM